MRDVNDGENETFRFFDEWSENLSKHSHQLSPNFAENFFF